MFNPGELSIAMKTEAVVFEGPSRVGIRSFDLPRLESNEVLVETQFSSISPGTELRTLAGKEKHAMPFPLIPGYSTVGKIADFGRNVRGLTAGSRVYLRGGRPLGSGLGSSWGGHARHLIVPEEEIFLLPQHADGPSATLSALLATALHGVDLAQVRIREQVAVVGLGLVGQLCARLLQYCGAHVVATDLVEHRRVVAERAGIPVVAPSGDLRQAFGAHFPHGAEAVLDATGSSRAMAGSIKLLRQRPRQDPCGESVGNGPESADTSMFEVLRKKSHLQNAWRGPRLIAQGSYADPITVNYYDLFDNEVGFIVPRVHEMKDMHRALELLVESRFNLDGLISEVVPYSKAAESYRRLQEQPESVITICFDWNGQG